MTVENRTPPPMQPRVSSCTHVAPELAGYLEVTCNRLGDHDGNHRHIRARDFVVLAEWTHDGAWITKPAGWQQQATAKRRVRL